MGATPAGGAPRDATIKQLRDSFASWLLTVGVPLLGWISKALGHADVGGTARHHATWCGAGTSTARR